MPKVKRLTITIPVDLAMRLEPYRGQLNLSSLAAKIFQETVEELEFIDKEKERRQREHEKREQMMREVQMMEHQIGELLHELQEERTLGRLDGTQAQARWQELDSMRQLIKELGQQYENLAKVQELSED